jgi:hypothetical protein
MIKYALRCEASHEFESWFSDSPSYDMQVKRGFVICPVCQSARVTKQIMSPRLSSGGKDRAENPPQEVSAVFDADAAAMREKMRAFRAFVLANTENVGRAFADESRAMHYGEKESRPISGEASGKDVRDLIEEGIAVLPVPALPEERN